MTNTNKGLVSLYISLFTLILFFNGCEDPGNVGSGFINEPTVKIDTVYLDDITTESLNGYAGNLASFNIGEYSDQIFGDIRSVGLIRPILYPFSPDTVSLNRNNFSMSLEIQLDSTITYGDTTSSGAYTIYEITSLWRGNSQRVSDVIQYNENEPIGNFFIDEERNYTVDLSSSWKDKYASYINNEDPNADSLYRYEFFGLAIVPESDVDKISIADGINSRFLMIDSNDDTIAVGLSSRGYFLERTNTNTSSGNYSALHSTLEQMMNIDFPLEELTNQYKDENILKAELILHEASQTLSGSTPTNHVRPDVNELTLNLKVSSEEEYQYQINGPNYLMNKDPDDPFFRTNITSYLNNVFFGGETNSEMLVGLRSSSGVLRSTLIYNQSASQELRPKLIITTAVNEDN